MPTSRPSRPCVLPRISLLYYYFLLKSTEAVWVAPAFSTAAGLPGGTLLFLKQELFLQVLPRAGTED